MHTRVFAVRRQLKLTAADIYTALTGGGHPAARASDAGKQSCSAADQPGQDSRSDEAGLLAGIRLRTSPRVHEKLYITTCTKLSCGLYRT